MGGCIDKCTDGWIGRWMDGEMDIEMNGRMYRCIDGWMNRWMNG